MMNYSEDELKILLLHNPDLKLPEKKPISSKAKGKRQNTEADLIRQIIEAGHLYGWLIAHFRGAWTVKGYRTAVQGDGAGFPDLVLVNERKGKVMFVEIKSNSGYLNGNQKMWKMAIESAQYCKYYIWRPCDWDDILKILRGGI